MIFLNSCELVTLVSTIACQISKCCSEEELAVLAAIFTQLGDTLATMIAHKNFCQKDTN
ncbi:MAG: DUF6774 domain-containing protein [Fusicatenibacter sp.]